MNTRIFILPIISFIWNKNDESLLQYLSSERQNKIHNFYFQSDKRHSLYSALLTKMQLSLALNTDASALSFGISQTSKPYLKDHPTVHFSFSHTKGCILLGISSSPIGVDIEKNQNPRFSIMSKYFHKEELSYVHSALLEEEKSKFFFHIWTKKEAFIKTSDNESYNNLKEINTQSSYLTHNFTTLSYRSFIYSVYSKLPLKEKPIILNETDIADFFKI